MADDGNRTEKGIAPAPFGPEEAATDDAGTADTVAPASISQPSASRSLPAMDRGRYKIQGEVGRGGLGRILRARDEYLDRPVAVKELLAPDEGAQARFVREALITARLQHPAIVPIYDAGQSEDKGPFYAMKLVAGASLHDKLADRQTLEQRLGLLPSVIAVVDAMAYAHSENIIHRDLKPQNVLVGKYGETVLIDWGLAKDLSEIENAPYRAASGGAASSSTQTLDGAVMGTPAFMPPEQAAGEEVDEKADVYALGAMLYFLIAGVPPHAGRSMDDMLLKIVSGDIVPVQEREPRCPADLAAIVGKAMQKEPKDRYPSAGELADDLKKFQTGQLVGAHAYTLNERFRRWLRKHRGIVAVATIALAILIGYGIWSIARIRTQKARAIAAAARADANAAEANTQRDKVRAQSMLVRARQYAATGHTAEEIAVLRALASMRDNPDAERMAIEDGGLIWKAHQRLAMALGDNVGVTHRTADGTRFVATVPGALVTWDVMTGKELVRMPLAGAAQELAARFGRMLGISPMGRFAIVRDCVPPATTCGVDIVSDGNVFVPGPQTELRLVEVATAKVLASWTRATGPLDRRALAFAPDDSAFAIRRTQLEIYAGATKEREVAACAGPIAVGSAQRIAIACKDKVVVHTERGSNEILKGAPQTQLAWLSADRLLALAGDKVTLWDVERGELRGEGALVQATAAREEEEDADEMPWSYFAPGAPKERGGEAVVPQIRVGHTTSIVARTSILAPPPRLTSAGAVLSLEGHDWQALVVQDDLVRYALVDQLVPAEPPDRCLSRVGSERHATMALDNGERLLVDQQELALGLTAAPPEGYRHTTTAEVPVRQLRPLVAAERDACLVWSPWSYGAHRIDGGIIPPLAGAVTTADGGIVVVGTREAFRIDRDGKRTSFASGSAPVISPSSLYIASIEADATTLAITSVATGQVVRRWTAPAGAPNVEWIGKDIVRAFGHVVTLDAGIAPRPYATNLATDPRSSIGVSTDGTEVRVEQLADGKQLARHAGAATAAVPFPDTSGRVIVTRADTRREILAPDGARVALAPLAGEILGYDVAGTLLLAHQRTRSDVWDLATGALVPIPAAQNLVAVLDDTFWLIDGKSTLVRTKRDGSQRTSLVLSTTGLAFQRIVDEVVISDDRKRISARYALDDERFAYAMWSTDSGALLWLGPATASIVGDWLVSGGRAYIPTFELAAVLRDSGARTNLRVCETDLRVVPVVPPPAPDTYWAPVDACNH